jgi:hypothetical protein
LVTIAALALAGSAVSSDVPEESDADLISTSDTRINIGRLGYINEQTLAIWRKLRSDESTAARYDLREMNHNLRRTVWEYNQLREDLCENRFAVEQSCGAPYVPKWVFQKDATTLDELDAREGDLDIRVVALWDAACKRLEKVISWEDSRPYCSVE